jgi:rubrerythrin
MSFLRSKIVVVRKDRKCFGCRAEIKKGNKSDVQTNIEDEKIYDIYLCLRCKEVTAREFTVGADDYFGEGELKRPCPNCSSTDFDFTDKGYLCKECGRLF